MTRNQFTFYVSFHKALMRIRRKTERCDAYDAICAYALYGVAPEPGSLGDMAEVVFGLIRPTLDTASRRAFGGKITAEIRHASAASGACSDNAPAMPGACSVDAPPMPGACSVDAPPMPGACKKEKEKEIEKEIEIDREKETETEDEDDASLPPSIRAAKALIRRLEAEGI